MRISLIQVNNNTKGIEARLEEIENQIKELDTDFVVLSELSTPGYIPNEHIWNYAEGNITKEWAINMAKKYNIYIGAGYVEKEEKDFYNSYLIANSDGVLGVVRKSEPESNIFKRGNFNHIIKTPLGNIAISICFDSHKKEFYESIKDEEISLILMPHAWPMNEKDYKNDDKKIDMLLNTYGRSFNVPIVFVNAIGDVEPMAGITGKLMNPKKFKLNGHSRVYLEDTIITNGNSNVLTFECNLVPKTRTKDITFYGNWLDKSNYLYRNIILPRDIRNGIKLYNKNIKRR